MEEQAQAMEKRLYLLDGMALVYRGYFALMRNPRMTSKGINTSSQFVFVNTLLDIIHNQKPSHLVAAFDTPEPTHRHKLFGDYKIQREAMPEDLSLSLPYIFKLCEAFNIPVIRMPGWEADDVIGTLTRLAEMEEFKSFMVTPDKDYAQLVSETTFISKPGRSGEKMEIKGRNEILNEWKIETVDQVVDILGLMGDSSDNVPGVPGIGPKTAQKLIAQFVSMERLLDNTSELSGKQRENLEKFRDQALLSKQLVTIEREVPIQVIMDDLRIKDIDKDKLKTIFLDLEFNTLGKRIFGEEFSAGPQKITKIEEETSSEFRTIEDTKPEYYLTDTNSKRKNLIHELNKQKSFCFDIETTSLDPRSCKILGLAFSFASNTGYYAPIPEEPEDAKTVLDTFRNVLENPNIEKIGHNLKFDYSVLLWNDLEVKGPFFDTMLAAALVTPELRKNLDYLSQALLGYSPISITELIGEKGDEQKTLREVDLDRVAQYAAEDADITLQLSEVLRPKIRKMGQSRVFGEIECPLLPVLAHMEFEGVKMDKYIIQELSKGLETEIIETQERIFELAGIKFNLNSPKQLGDLLFDTLELDPKARRTTKSKQYQTSESVLQKLAPKHQIVKEIMNYRTFTKLKSTYLDTLPKNIFKKTGRVHTHYEQTVTSTGRLQSHNPNLQNIPIRTEKGREIRKAFVSKDENYVLLSADYSQIELRVAAELSKDKAMTQTFQEGGDIHNTTAMKIYNIDQETVTEDMRRNAKTVNFGIIYGISAFGLAERLDISRYQASQLIDQYFKEFPGTQNYMDETIAFAQKNSYVETMTGRRRYLRDINSRNATTRKQAERNAINSRIQGTAADMIKIAMHRIHSELKMRKLKTRMLLQVHDELVFDLYRNEASEVMEMVEVEMKTAIPMSVPIEVEMGIGKNWHDAH